MGDTRVRELERLATVGDLAARRELLEWRLRTKRLDRDRLRLAAYLGDPTAGGLCATQGWTVPQAVEDLLEWVAGLGAWDRTVSARAAAAIARAALAPWEQRTACKACGWRNATPAQRKACPKHREDLKPRRAVEALEDWIRAPSQDRSDAAMRQTGSLGWINSAAASTRSFGLEQMVKAGELNPKDVPAVLARDACENARRAAEAALKEVDAAALRRAIQHDLVPWAVAHRDPLDERVPASPWRVGEAPSSDSEAAWRSLERARDTATRTDCLRELVRLGELTRKRLEVARALGDDTARAALAKSRRAGKPKPLIHPLTALHPVGPGAAAAAVALARHVASLIAPAKARKRAAACLKAAEATLQGDASGLEEALDDARRLAHELSGASGAAASAARACAFALDAAVGRRKRAEAYRALRSAWANAVDAVELRQPAKVRSASEEALKVALKAFDGDDDAAETEEALNLARDATPVRRVAIAEAATVARQAGIAWALSRDRVLP